MGNSGHQSSEDHAESATDFIHRKRAERIAILKASAAEAAEMLRAVCGEWACVERDTEDLKTARDVAELADTAERLIEEAR